MSKNGWIVFCLIVLVLPLSANQLMAQEADSTEEQIAALKANCEESAEARAERQKEKSLYERLGGYEKIHELTKEIVRLHIINDDIKHMFTHIDTDDLAKQVADFVAAGTGGIEEYKGRTMPASHEHLKLTDADFLSAGHDIVQAMKNLGHGENEIGEVMCILLSLKDQVVIK